MEELRTPTLSQGWSLEGSEELRTPQPILNGPDKSPTKVEGRTLVTRQERVLTSPVRSGNPVRDKTDTPKKFMIK